MGKRRLSFVDIGITTNGMGSRGKNINRGRQNCKRELRVQPLGCFCGKLCVLTSICAMTETQDVLNAPDSGENFSDHYLEPRWQCLHWQKLKLELQG